MRNADGHIQDVADFGALEAIQQHAELLLTSENATYPRANVVFPATGTDDVERRTIAASLPFFYTAAGGELPIIKPWAVREIRGPAAAQRYSRFQNPADQKREDI
jgi:hypothetical protein